VLPANARLRSSKEFQQVFRHGVKIHRDVLVLYVSKREQWPARAGLVVSKAVGNAVKRNKVKRRLRHLITPVLATTPVPLDFVIRALPGAANADLNNTLTSALSSSYERLGLR